MTLIVDFLVNAASLWVLDVLFDNISFSSYSVLFVTAFALMIVNALVKPILKILSLPLTILTLGLFSFVVNALVLMLAFNLTKGAYIGGLGTAILASIVLAIINPIFMKLTRK